MANYLKKNVKSRRLLSHNSENREKILEKHKKSKTATVLLSPSMTEGVDLHGDLSRFQVVCKIPYPYLGDKLIRKNKVSNSVLLEPVAAISVGIVDGIPRVDLCYEEDSRADVDLNVVMSGENAFVEVQGTAEGKIFTKEELDEMLALASNAIQDLFQYQYHNLDVINS